MPHNRCDRCRAKMVCRKNECTPDVLRWREWMAHDCGFNQNAILWLIHSINFNSSNIFECDLVLVNGRSCSLFCSRYKRQKKKKIGNWITQLINSLRQVRRQLIQIFSVFRNWVQITFLRSGPHRESIPLLKTCNELQIIEFDFIIIIAIDVYRVLNWICCRMCRQKYFSANFETLKCIFHECVGRHQLPILRGTRMRAKNNNNNNQMCYEITS